MLADALSKTAIDQDATALVPAILGVIAEQESLADALLREPGGASRSADGHLLDYGSAPRTDLVEANATLAKFLARIGRGAASTYPILMQMVARREETGEFWLVPDLLRRRTGQGVQAAFGCA